MQLFKRQKDNTSTPEEPQTDYSGYTEPEPTVPATDTSDGRRFVTIPSLIILIVVVVVLGIVLSYNGTKPATSPKKAPAKSGTSHNVQKTPAPTQSAAAGSNNGAQPTTPGSLNNTGPGDVIGLFIATTVAAAGLHYVIVLRRLRAD